MSAAAAEVLTPDEQRLLLWNRPPRTVKTARWSAADVLLIDEAAGLVDRVPSYGHIVLDEAQDLSPMQCRAIARRCEHGSLTVLGDLAQGTAPWAAVDWRTTMSHLGKPDAAVVPLTLGFRVPAVVVDMANRLLPALEVSVPEAVSLRRDGSLDIHRVDDLSTGTVTEAKAALALEGSIAVICSDGLTDQLASALREAAVPFVFAGGPGPNSIEDPTEPGASVTSTESSDSAVSEESEESEEDSRITLLPASLAKGLEFDHVIVVEPDEIVRAEPRGLNRLYVVLTRAVSRLSIVHRARLPL